MSIVAAIFTNKYLLITMTLHTQLQLTVDKHVFLRLSIVVVVDNVEHKARQEGASNGSRSSNGTIAKNGKTACTKAFEIDLVPPLLMISLFCYKQMSSCW